MNIYISGKDLDFDYGLHSLGTSFSGSPDVSICKGEGNGLNVFYGENEATFSMGEHTLTVKFDESDKREATNIIKAGAYKVLSAYYDKELPWGTLSGVRPTKIPMRMLNEGYSDNEILKALKEVYLISDSKNELGLKVAKKEREILSPINVKDGYSLYIGIPFCPTTCAYCSFTSYPINAMKNKVDDYISALVYELGEVSKMFKDKTLQSIYIGGGTPTSISAEQLDKLLIAVDDNFDRKKVLEYTVEAGRPDSITIEKLEVIKKHNVSRISVNPQTLNQKTLELIGRRHTVDQTVECFNMARELGFTNINMDFIVGLPGESYEDLAYSMEEVKKLKPDNLTFHALAVKRAGRIRSIQREGAQNEYEKKLLSSEITDKHMQLTEETARQMGMEPYYLYRQQSMTGSFENVGYATEGNEGIYNILMMEEVQSIVACGCGTVTKRVFEDEHIERCDNVKDVGLYIEKIEEMIERKRQLFNV